MRIRRAGRPRRIDQSISDRFAREECSVWLCESAAMRHFQHPSHHANDLAATKMRADQGRNGNCDQELEEDDYLRVMIDIKDIDFTELWDYTFFAQRNVMRED